MRIELCVAVAVAGLLAGLPAAAAQSGYASAPFRDQPLELAQAAAIERLEVAARALAIQMPDSADDDKKEAAAGGEAEGEGEEEKEGDPALDFALFGATLAAASPELEQKLAAAIEEMVESSESGESAAAPVREVIDLVEEARATLVPTGADSPGFRAALIASLLLDKGGVAEGYEEAVGGDASAYAAGRFALQRVKVLWDGLKTDAMPERVADVEAMLAILEVLFSTEAMPEHMSPDPEQAEAPAQQLVGLLEAVSNADLYPGRDLAGATEMVRKIAASGCEAIAAQKRGIGLERMRIASAYYAQTIEATLGVLAPDAASAIADGLEALEDADTDSSACGPLLAAIDAGQKALSQ